MAVKRIKRDIRQSLLALASETAGSVGDDLLKLIVDPQWPDRARDWRGYVAPGIKVFWASLSEESRLAILANSVWASEAEFYRDSPE